MFTFMLYVYNIHIIMYINVGFFETQSVRNTYKIKFRFAVANLWSPKCF